MTPAADGNGMALVAYGTGNPALQYNGSNATSLGTIFAPNGTINFNGSGGHNSSVIGYKVSINGSKYTVSDASEGGGNTYRTVSLVY